MKKYIEKIMAVVFFICGFVAVAAVALITIYMVVSGLPAIREIGLTEFLFGRVWASTAAEPKYGILPFILTSVYGTAGAILIGVPIGLLTAVYLAKLAPPKVAAALRPVIELLAGIPSVVYGLVGMLVLVPAVAKVFGLANGTCLFAAILVLAIMLLPTIVQGAMGLVSGGAHIFGHEIRAIFKAFAEGDNQRAKELFVPIYRFCKSTGQNGRILPNSILRPAIELVTGIHLGPARSPLAPATEEEMAVTTAILREIGKLN